MDNVSDYLDGINDGDFCKPKTIDLYHAGNFAKMVTYNSLLPKPFVSHKHFHCTNMARAVFENEDCEDLGTLTRKKDEGITKIKKSMEVGKVNGDDSDSDEDEKDNGKPKKKKKLVKAKNFCPTLVHVLNDIFENKNGTT